MCKVGVSALAMPRTFHETNDTLDRACVACMIRVGPASQESTIVASSPSFISAHIAGLLVGTPSHWWPRCLSGRGWDSNFDCLSDPFWRPYASQFSAKMGKALAGPNLVAPDGSPVVVVLWNPLLHRYAFGTRCDKTMFLSNSCSFSTSITTNLLRIRPHATVGAQSDACSVFNSFWSDDRPVQEQGKASSQRRKWSRIMKKHAGPGTVRCAINGDWRVHRGRPPLDQ